MTHLPTFKDTVEHNNTILNAKKAKGFYDNFFNLQTLNKKAENEGEFEKNINFFHNQSKKYQDAFHLFTEQRLFDFLCSAMDNGYLASAKSIEKNYTDYFTPLFQTFIDKFSQEKALLDLTEQVNKSDKLTFKLFQLLSVIDLNDEFSQPSTMMGQKFNTILTHFFNQWSYTNIANQMTPESSYKYEAQTKLSHNMFLKIIHHYGIQHTENNSSPFLVAIHHNQLEIFKYLETKTPYDSYDNYMNKGGKTGFNTSMNSNLSVALFDVRFSEHLSYQANMKLERWPSIEPMLNYLYEKDKHTFNYEQHGMHELFKALLSDGQILAINFLKEKGFDFSKPSYDYYIESIDEIMEKNKYFFKPPTHEKVKELKNHIASLEKERIEKLIEDKPLSSKKIKL